MPQTMNDARTVETPFGIVHSCPAFQSEKTGEPPPLVLSLFVGAVREEQGTSGSEVAMPLELPRALAPAPRARVLVREPSSRVRAYFGRKSGNTPDDPWGLSETSVYASCRFAVDAGFPDCPASAHSRAGYPLLVGPASRASGRTAGSLAWRPALLCSSRRRTF